MTEQQKLNVLFQQPIINKSIETVHYCPPAMSCSHFFP